MILLTARVKAHVPERRELAQALLDWATAARSEEGALGSHVYEDIEAPAVFCLVSEWESRAAFDAHVGGPKFGILLGALELLAWPPQVAITQVADESGGHPWLTIQRLRGIQARRWTE